MIRKIVLFIVLIVSSCDTSADNSKATKENLQKNAETFVADSEGQGKDQLTEAARQKADDLLNKIAEGTANDEFPVRYFPLYQTEILMKDLKDECDFRNRKGLFLNEYYSNDTLVSLIYEFYLKCDSIRFIISYSLVDGINLQEFKLEPIEKTNYMIHDQRKRLKY